MKSGETRFVVKKLDTKKPYTSVGFRLSNGKTTIKKSTDAQETKDKVLVRDGVFLIPLQQADTNALQGNVTLEAQINYQDHSVIMSDDNFLYINSSLGYDQVQGSKPAEDDGIEVVMTAIEEGVAVIVNPEASQELIDAVTQLFQDTKQIAQSVRDDADNGVFDGDDGYSPQVTVKTETPSTYVLHIKDADHEYDTPNLKGSGGGGGSYTDGDGIKIENDEISVDLKDGEQMLGFENGKLWLNGTTIVSDTGFKSTMPYDETIRQRLAYSSPSIRHALATKESVDGKQNALTVGDGIDITNNEISAKIVSSGNILKFASGELVVSGSDIVDDFQFKNALPYDATIRERLLQNSGDYNFQPKLTAGTNITIDSNNVISSSGSGTSYTFTDGLTESSGTVGIDIASESKLFIDNNDKLDVDLSSKQDTIDSTHKLSADNVDDTSTTNKFVSASEKSKIADIDDKQDKTDITTDTTSTTVSLTLADNHEYRYTQDLTSLTLTMPSGDFIASIVFASGSTPTSMTYDSSIKWSGNDVTNGQFVPTEKTYNIVMWYDGINVNGVVRGV